MAAAQLGALLHQIHRLAAPGGPGPRTDRDLLEAFTARRDEAAFAALVGRHGPMVLRVCRRVLAHEQDAEDAFQATFLVLAQQVRSIRKREALAGWLHGVAYRTAMKAKRGAARRRQHEARVTPPPPQAAPDPSWGEVQAALDEELQRLPERARSAFVLHVLEGKTVPEVAAALGCKKGTVYSRLAQARQLLRRRLVRRGIELSALLAALAVADGAGRAAVPAALARGAIRYGLLVAAGGTAAGTIPSRIAALAAGVTRAMFLTKAKLVTAVLLALTVLAAGAGALVRQALAAEGVPPESQKAEASKPKPAPAARKPSAADENNDGVEVSGRVVDPDGKPFAGAKVFFARYILNGDGPPPPAVASDAEGRFRLRVSRAGYPEAYMKDHWMRGAVVAVGRGFAFGWAGGDNAEKLKNVTIRLAKDVPIEGHVVDLQGKPIAGVSVQVRGVRCREDGGDLKAFVEQLPARKNITGGFGGPSWPGLALGPALLGLPRPPVTGADGKFRVTGIPAECIAVLRFAGPTIETAEVNALTRPAPTVVTPRSGDRPELGNVVYHGNTFTHAAAPTRPIVGTVRDRDTGRPLAGMTVRSRMGPIAQEHFALDPYLEVTTDAEGRYRLVGLTREAGHRLEALPSRAGPYLPATKTSGAPPGLEPVTVDFALKRGVVIRGRVTDKATGRPVRVLVRYAAFADNPHLKEVSGLRGIDDIEARTGADGSFALVGLPGRGLLAARAAGREPWRYVAAAGADEIKGPRWGEDHFDTEPQPCDPFEFNTLAEVNPARGAASVVCDLALDPGRTVTGTIVDPDGKPVTGASIDGVRAIWLQQKDLSAAQFRITGVDPKHPGWYFFRHRGRNLGAVVSLKGDEPAPVTVHLQPCATVTGRVVDDDGLPRAAWVTAYIHKGQLGSGYVGIGLGMERSGKDGRLRIKGIFPGLKIGLMAGKNTTYFDTLIRELTLKPGEVRDVGDVKAKPGE